MDVFDRERLAARLVSGHETFLLDFDGARRPFGLRPPTPADRLEAAEAACAARDEAALQGVLCEDDIVKVLRGRGLWNDRDENEYETARKNVDELKVQLFSASTQRLRETARAALAKTKPVLRVLSGRRGEGRDRSVEALAEAARVRSLVAACLLRADGSPAFPRGAADDCSLLLDTACHAYATSRASEAELREVARTEPWRSLWGSREACNAVFPGPASGLTDEQKLLVAWTRVYDNAAQDPDGPDEEQTADDDAFDGWLIKRRRGKGDATKDRIERSITNPKIAGADEVMVIAALPGEAVSGLSPDEVAAVERLNSPAAARLKVERAAQVARRGALHEAELVDQKQRILMELASRGVG